MGLGKRDGTVQAAAQHSTAHGGGAGMLGNVIATCLTGDERKGGLMSTVNAGILHGSGAAAQNPRESGLTIDTRKTIDNE